MAHSGCRPWLMSQHWQTLAAHLLPHGQFGVGLKGGLDMIVHATTKDVYSYITTPPSRITPSCHSTSATCLTRSPVMPPSPTSKLTLPYILSFPTIASSTILPIPVGMIFPPMQPLSPNSCNMRVMHREIPSVVPFPPSPLPHCSTKWLIKC